MAARSKKDVLIEEAQKLTLRGQFDNAAKAYEQIVAMEPAAVNLRQKLAELLVKCGRNDDARKELDAIGKHFSKNGFYLKAIAVYKQLQKLFPSDISLSLTLAELNEKHGLVANALSEYKLVYDFYEKASNAPEALDILDRMQKVDPQNIAIKIKLAEAYYQKGKKDPSYTVFAKTAALLLERGDNATLSKIRARIQQIFPDKPDFIIEVLNELLHQGNASAAIDCLQGLLRSNPNNKRAWDMIVLAYQLLDQPQRVKIAHQHYLKFFPAEPTAMLGLISSVTAEQNLSGALELLNQYEADLIATGFLPQLEQIYRSLEKLEPINIRILEGLLRVVTAAGNESEVRSIKSKLESLHYISGEAPGGSITLVSPSALSDIPPLGVDNANEPSSFGDFFSQQTTSPAFEINETEPTPKPTSNIEQLDADVDAVQHPDDEIEIEIDDDSPFGVLVQEISTTPPYDDWLESIGYSFDTIVTAPRGVKFGNEMDISDAQSHFDLGQAFKEMGLYDEAINEFRQASQEASRRLNCLIMQCACLRERGEVEKSIGMLQAMLKPGLTEEESCTVKYELATGYEVAGKKEEANLLLSEINAANPGFRDIDSRINSASSSQSLDFSDEDLDDFGFK